MCKTTGLKNNYKRHTHTHWCLLLYISSALILLQNLVHWCICGVLHQVTNQAEGYPLYYCAPEYATVLHMHWKCTGNEVRMYSLDRVVGTSKFQIALPDAFFVVFLGIKWAYDFANKNLS